MTDEDIIAIRDEHLPSQGEAFDALAFGRAVEAAARQDERERCAKVCEDISDEYQRREGRKYPELKSDAESGASKCAAAIRAD